MSNSSKNGKPNNPALNPAAESIMTALAAQFHEQNKQVIAAFEDGDYMACIEMMKKQGLTVATLYSIDKAQPLDKGLPQ